LRIGPHHIEAEDAVILYHDMGPLYLQEDLVTAVVDIEAGASHTLLVSSHQLDEPLPTEYAARMLSITSGLWQEWIAYYRHDGPYKEAIRRRALALKLLTFAPTGAIAAPPTTSLPEGIGGIRNWGYRFRWLRDAASAFHARAAPGYGGEARRFSEFLPHVCGDIS